MARTYFKTPKALLQCKATTPKKIYVEDGINALQSYIEYLTNEKRDCHIGYCDFSGKLDGRLYPSYVKELSIWQSFYDKIIENN